MFPLTLPSLRDGPLPLPAGARGKDGAERSLSQRGEGQGEGACVAMNWLAAAYPWIKAAHIVSVVAWMAGLLYLPRLFVYHAEARPGSDAAATFKVMERRLLRGIMNPAMIATWAFGITLALTPGIVD